MGAFYRTKLNTEPAQALAVHCCDARFVPAFLRFLTEGLALSSWQTLAVPGGPRLLAQGESAGAEDPGWSWFEFLVERGRPFSVLLIAHSDCLWYLHGPCSHSPEDCYNRQTEDLQVVRERIRRRFPELPVRVYYAQAEGSDVFFREL